MKKSLVFILAILAPAATYAADQSEVAWQLPLDFRAAGSPTSECGIAGLHVLPSGNLMAVTERRLGPAGVYVSALTPVGGVIRTTSMWTSEPPSPPKADYTGSDVDQFGRLFLSLNLNYKYRFFRLSPDALIQTSIQYPGGQLISSVDASGNTDYGLKDFAFERRSPGGGLIFRHYSALGLGGSTQVIYCQRTPDGGSVIAGSILEPDGGSALRKFDGAGNLIFERIILAGNSEAIHGVKGDSSGNLYVLSIRQPLFDMRVTKFRGTDGAQLWQRTMPSSVSTMAMNGDGNLVLTLHPAGAKPQLLRLTQAGGFYQPVTLTAASVDSIAHLLVDANNEIYTHGDAGAGKVFITRHSPTGAIRFTQIVSNPNGSLSRDLVRVDSNSGQIALATSLTPVGQKPYGNLVGISQVPIAKNDSFIVPANQPSMPGSFLVNDQYAKGAGIVVSKLPTHGTLTWGPSGVFKYTPAPGYVGADSFTYRLTRGNLASFSAIVSLTVQ